MSKKLILESRPGKDFPKALNCFSIKLYSKPEYEYIKQNEVILELLYVSIDPVMRVWMSGAKTYLPPLKLQKPMIAFALGRVIGNYVLGNFPIQSYVIVNPTKDKTVLKIIQIDDIPIHYYMNFLGKPKKNDTVLVSTAAGATGIFVCQFAKNIGCNVIGICGSEKKRQFLLETLKISNCINYTLEKDIKKTIKSLCPQGIDIYFDNVGEYMLDAALANMNEGGRVVLCGATSTYLNYKKIKGIVNFPLVVLKRLVIRGFTFYEAFKEIGEIFSNLLQMLRDKKVQVFEEILSGFEEVPLGLQKIFLGENIGKVIVEIHKEDEKAKL